MAAIDFPTNPTNGDTYSPAGLDTIYTYQDGVWTGAVSSPDIYLKLIGGDMTGDVQFLGGTGAAEQKIFLSTTGNATFKGDVDIDGNLELGTIADVEAAILAATPGGDGNQISSGTSVLNFTAENGSLQANVTFQPTENSADDLGTTSLGWRNAYVNKKLTMGTDLTTPYIVVDGETGKFKGIGDLEIGPIDSPAVIVDNDGTVQATSTITVGPIGGTAAITLNTSGEITGTSLSGTGQANVIVDSGGKLVRGAGVPTPLWTQNTTNLYPADADSNLMIGGTLPASPNAQITALGAATFASATIDDGDLVINTSSTASITLQNDGDIVMSGQITGCTGVSGSDILTVAGAGIVLSNTAAGSYVFTNAGSATNKGTLDFSATTSTRTYTFPDKDGTVAMTSDFTGTGVTFKGTIDVTTDAAPTSIAGDFYLNTVQGNALASYTGLNQGVVAQNQFVFFTSSADWVLGGLTEGVNTTISPNAPTTSPDAGDMWWNSDDGRLYIYYNDGASAQWVDASPNTPVAGVSSVASGDGLTGGPITDTGTLAVQASNSTITVAAGGISVNQAQLTDLVAVAGDTMTGTLVGASSAISGTWDLSIGNYWTLGNLSVPTPTNMAVGTSGLIVNTAAAVWPVAGGATFQYAGGNPPDITEFPAVIPYYCPSGTEIYIGNPTTNIT